MELMSLRVEVSLSACIINLKTLVCGLKRENKKIIKNYLVWSGDSKLRSSLFDSRKVGYFKHF